MKDLRIDIGGAFSPWGITVAVWCGIGVLFLLFGDRLYDLTEQFYVALALWCGTLVPIALTTYNLLPDRCEAPRAEGIDVNPYCYYGLLALTLVLSPLHIRGVLASLQAYDFDNFLLGLRMFALEDGYIAFPRYAYVLSHVVLIVSLWAYPRIPLWALVCSVTAALAEALLIMEKGGIFFVLLCCIYVLYERRKIHLRTIGISIGLIFVLFWLMNAFREGMTSEIGESDFLFDFLGMYVMSPAVAFGRSVQDISTQFGANTFETIYLFLHRFGANVEVQDKVQEFVFVPVSTNVYTIMRPFFRDFGYTGVAVFGAIYGILTGILYRCSRNGNGFCRCLYTFVVTMLVLQFYQENIFLGLVYVLQLSFFLWLITQRKIQWSKTSIK